MARGSAGCSEGSVGRSRGRGRATRGRGSGPSRLRDESSTDAPNSSYVHGDQLVEIAATPHTIPQSTGLRLDDMDVGIDDTETDSSHRRRGSNATPQAPVHPSYKREIVFAGTEFESSISQEIMQIFKNMFRGEKIWADGVAQ